MTAILAVLCVAGWLSFAAVWRVRGQEVRVLRADLDDVWNDYRALGANFLDLCDEADKEAAKLRWRINQRGPAPRDVPITGLSALYLRNASGLRHEHGRLAHARLIDASRRARLRAEQSARGVP